MNDIQPYQQPDPATLTEVDSWVPVLESVGKLAAAIAGTDFVPRDFRGKPAAVAATILFGREVGLPPMTALKNTYVVHGTPDLSAEAQRALVLAAGHDIEFVETTDTRAIIRGRRKGTESWTEVRYTLDEAKRSGDAKKNSNYATRPQEMLVARATARLCSRIYPDVVGGFTAAAGVAPADPDDTPAADDTPPAPKVTVEQPPAKPKPRRTTKAKTAAPPALPAEPTPAPSGPPLPGEDGYDQLAEPVIVDEGTGEILDPHPDVPEPFPPISGPCRIGFGSIRNCAARG